MFTGVIAVGTAGRLLAVLTAAEQRAEQSRGWVELL